MSGPRPIRAPRGTELTTKGWLQEAALACQLTLVDAPDGPSDIPSALAEDGDWFVPHGGLLGF